MIDYSYVECTSASLQALLAFSHHTHFPQHRKEEISRAAQAAVKFINNKQRPDGSWYGSWAVCFTYGTWFGVEGLMAAGEFPDSPAIRKAVAFLLSKQNEDGGWGETYMSCVTKEYVQKESQVVNTAWAALTLMCAEYHLTDRRPVERAIKFILSRQRAAGDWEQEGISGVFNNSCMISYINYRNIFPIWALGRWMKARKDMTDDE